MTRKANQTSEQPHKEVAVGGANNGSKRLVPANKAPRYYPAEDAPQPQKTRRKANPTRLRSSIVPGTVLILLAGRYRGKRVIFLKQLTSGLLLVTGPYKINGVPLRRVNQAYVIATSTKVDVGNLQVDEKIDDSYFTKPRSSTRVSAEEEFFADGKPKEKEAYSEAKSTDQKNIDKALIEKIKQTDNLSKYLKASFGLSKGQFPHQLVF